MPAIDQQIKSYEILLTGREKGIRSPPPALSSAESIRPVFQVTCKLGIAILAPRCDGVLATG